MAAKPAGEKATKPAGRTSVEQPLWRALAGYRVLTAGWAVTVFVWEYEHYTYRLLGTAYVTVLVLWTLATLPWVSSARRCTKRFLAADLGIALTGVLISPLLDPPGLVAPTLPTIWSASPVLAFAIKGGWRWGAASSLLLGLTNIIESQPVNRSTLHNILLVCISATAIGYVVEVARASERTLARALQIDAATRERERLARDIHDSVLQVLAMVQRRGTAIGGDAADLGRMAGEQEVALRTLISRDVTPAPGAAAGEGETPAAAPAAATVAQHPPGAEAGDTQPAPTAVSAGSAANSGDTSGSSGDAGGIGDAGGARDAADTHCDLRALLSPYAGGWVTFSEPGSPVWLRADAARELTAAVGAALDNVRQHARSSAGAAASAWVLLEDEPDAVLVTVRDDGPGIPEGRLAAAETEGRLGVALSIRGRLHELGGSAEWVSVPQQGTEVELRVPKND